MKTCLSMYYLINHFLKINGGAINFNNGAKNLMMEHFNLTMEHLHHKIY